MGAVPSRECTSLFSYFRGSYEVGMVPLTKFYFGNDKDAAAAGEEIDGSLHVTQLAGATSTEAKAAPPAGASVFAGPRTRMRQQLRQQLLLMRRDPAVLYANAREAENVLQSLWREEKCTGNATHLSPADSASAASSATTSSKKAPSPGATANTSSTSAAVDALAPAAEQGRASAPSNSGSRTDSPTGASDSDADALEDAHAISSAAAKRLLGEYWNVMPDDNFAEADLDRFLDLVDATLFDTNDELLGADPVQPGLRNGQGATAAAAPTKTFMPVPCALCLAYPDGKERDGAFSLDGRVINIIGYFGLMTPEMQDAFKVVKRLPSEAEKQQQQQQAPREAASTGGAALPLMYLNTAILTSAGDRTLERVLVLAAVMLRQQFHTIGRRHVLQAKLDRLLREQREQQLNVDPQVIRYLHTLLALPAATEPHKPFFDPLLEIPLPSIPSGIYTPTQYVNAASNGPPMPPVPSQPPQRLASGVGSFAGTAATLSLTDSTAAAGSVPMLLQPTSGTPPASISARSLSHDAATAAATAPFLPSSIAAGARRALLTSHQRHLSGSTASLTAPSARVQGSCPGSERACTLDMDGAAAPGMAMAFPPTPAPTVYGLHPLDQGDEDAITLALCRRLEGLRVVIETASNNYSVLKSLTENFAFLHCQILLDEDLTTVELVDLPALVATSTFQPADLATTVASTVATSVNADATSGEAVAALPPWSAVLIKLDPLHVRQATMWASSFFHCPTLLPSGDWVKYKLKDECEQLRHVLQNKDMLIAHWRKADAAHADRYMGPHTARLLEHVRALQAETEEARALPADHWTQRLLYVNQDGRKYALYESRYGTMLIGVRAFAPAATAGGPTASTTSATGAGAGASAGSNVGDGAKKAKEEGGLKVQTGAGPGGALIGGTTLGNAGAGRRGGNAAAAAGVAVPPPPPPSVYAGAGLNAKMVHQPPSSYNGHVHDHYNHGVGAAYGAYPNGAAPPAAAPLNPYQPAPYMAPPPNMYMNGPPPGMPAHHHHQQQHKMPHNGYDATTYMMMNKAKPGEVPAAPVGGYRPAPAMQGYLMGIAAGYGAPQRSSGPAPSHYDATGGKNMHAAAGADPHVMAGSPITAQSQQRSSLPNSLPNHAQYANRVQMNAPVLQMQPMPSPHPPSMPQYHTNALNPMYGATPAQHMQQQQQQQGAYMSATSSPRYPAASPAPTPKAPASPHPQATAAVAAAVPSAAPAVASQKSSTPPQSKSPHSGATAATTAAPAAGHSLDAGRGEETSPTAGVLKSVMPWSLQGATGWSSAEETTEATTQFLMRSADLFDVDDDGEAVKKAAGGSDNAAASRAGEDGTGGSNRFASLVADWEKIIASANSGAVTSPTSSSPAEKVEMSIMHLLLSAAPHTPSQSEQYAHSQPPQQPPQQRQQPQLSEVTAASTVGAWPLTFPTVADPAFAAPALTPAYQPGGVFPVYVLQMPSATPQQQPQPAVSSPTPAAPAPGKPLYYTIANGVPLLVQPAATPDGMAVAYPIGQPFPHAAEGQSPYPGMPMALPPPPQQPQQQQPSVLSAPAARFSAQPGARWGGQYRFLSSGPGNLAGFFGQGMTPPYPGSDGSGTAGNSGMHFQPSNGYA